MSDIKSIKNNLKKLTSNEGCIIFGVAEIDHILNNINIQPKEVLNGLTRAISTGYVLSERILQTNVESPSKLYAHHYKKINIILDVTALKITSYLHQSGYSALPVGASQLLDWKNLSAHLSHRKIGIMAGLGWFGKNNLLINPEYGAHARYITVLTDAPLEADIPLKQTCPTECKKCINACPAKAIGDSPDDFNLELCLDKLKNFSSQPGIGQFICGICVNACKGKRNG